MTRRLLGLLAVLLLAAPVWAQVGNWRAFEFFGLTGGLNDTVDSTSIKPTEAVALQNIVFSTSGAITKRSGFTHLNTTTLRPGATATGVAFYKQASGNRYLVTTIVSGTLKTVEAIARGEKTGHLDLPPPGTGGNGNPIPSKWWAATTISWIAEQLDDLDRKADLQQEAGKFLEAK